MAWWRFRSSTCELEMASQMVTWSEELFSSVWFSLKYVQIHHPGKSYGCFQMTFYLSSFSPAGQVSWVSQKGPLLGEMFCCCHLNNCRTRCPHFHSGQSPANFVCSFAFLMGRLWLTCQMWAFTSQFRPLSPSRNVCSFHCFHETVLSNITTDAVDGIFILVKLCISNAVFNLFLKWSHLTVMTHVFCHFLIWFFFFGFALPAFSLGPAPHLEVPSKTEQSVVELFFCSLTPYQLSHLPCGMHINVEFHHPCSVHCLKPKHKPGVCQAVLAATTQIS